MIKHLINLEKLLKNKIFLIIIFFFTSSCSFDGKTGIWSGAEDEKKRILDLKNKKKNVIKVENVYTSDVVYLDELEINQSIKLSNAKLNKSWQMSGLNNQNFITNLHLPSVNNIFLKKKIGKNKFSISKRSSSILTYNDNILIADDKGTIFYINQYGKVIWKKNIYKKIYKKIYKNLSLSIYNDNIYISDNVGFIYSINLISTEINWIKNHATPLKSNIKIYDDKLLVIDQNNKILAIDINDGSKKWDILGISSFIKSQTLMSLAVTNDGNLLAINSSADLFKIQVDTGKIFWTANTLSSLYNNATDFFESSDIVISENEVFVSAGSSFLSYDLISGITNWENKITSVSAPIIINDNIFIVSKNGYFAILDRKSGKIISSTNILKVLKKKLQQTEISGFIMGSGKIYSVTLNGNLIISNASTGKVESSKKIGDIINSSPIISSGKLYILTENSKIIGYN